jgi:phosphoserine phosphatase
MFHRQIEQFMFRVSPAQIWEDYPKRDLLDTIFADIAGTPDGRKTQHPSFETFASLLLSWYYDQLAEGKVTKACADIVRLFAGYAEEEVRTFADACFSAELKAPLANRVIGGRSVDSGVRYLAESLALIKALHEHGVDIWAVSGSSKWSVEPVFRALGVPHERVIGIALEASNGVLSPTARMPIPIREEKIHALRAVESRVPVLVASDSRNDIPLLKYSSRLKVWINSRKRSTEEFFAAVGSPPDDQWIVIEEPTILMN